MTRVTQSMLSSNMLRNLNNSYNKMSKYQEMLNSGMKIARASDDPVVAVKGMKYRTQLDKVDQYKRNLNEAEAWLDTTDTALDQVGNVLNRVKELVVQAANDTNTADDRDKIKQEIDQIKQQMMDVANTQVGGKYIFSGTNTQKPLFVEVSGNDAAGNPAVYRVENMYKYTIPNDPTSGVVSPLDGQGNPLTLNNPITAPNGQVKIEVFDGVQLTVNSNAGPEIFTKVDSILGQISEALGTAASTGEDISKLLGGLADGTNNSLADAQALVLNARADVGARQNRVELMMNRLDIQKINVTKQKSLNEDTDYSKTITDMVTTESIHQAALSVGAKIIQQTLVDFIR